jgi:hypothetical protein
MEKAESQRQASLRFPLPLETPQNRRAFHIPTASTAGPCLYGQNPKTLAENINPGGGPN